MDLEKFRGINIFDAIYLSKLNIHDLIHKDGLSKEEANLYIELGNLITSYEEDEEYDYNPSKMKEARVYPFQGKTIMFFSSQIGLFEKFDFTL